MARQNSGRRTTQDLKQYLIDIRDWYRRGMIQPHAESTEVYYPRRDGRFDNGVVSLAWTNCTFGGCRAWFLCPQCGRRVAILYCPNVIACRQCYRLTFRSQRENFLGRDFRRINKLRARLNWPSGVMHGVFSRPKGMHHKTFNRLMDIYRKLELAVLLGMQPQFDAMTSELDVLRDAYGKCDASHH